MIKFAKQENIYYAGKYLIIGYFKNEEGELFECPFVPYNGRIFSCSYQLGVFEGSFYKLTILEVETECDPGRAGFICEEKKCEQYFTTRL